MHRGEVKLRTNLLGEQAKSIRPLSEARYVPSSLRHIARNLERLAHLLQGDRERRERHCGRVPVQRGRCTNYWGIMAKFTQSSEEKGRR